MPVVRSCKVCGKQITIYMTTQNKCRTCTIKKAKPIPQRGKQARMWETFRDKVAIPYLDKKYGHVCSVSRCNETRVDVDHIKGRGSNPQLRYQVTNLRYLCRAHHIERTGTPQWTNKP